MRGILLMGVLLVGTLGVALHTLPATSTPPHRPHPPLSVNDTIAFRAAIQHGRALVRNEQTEEACRAEREKQYARFDRLYYRGRVLPPFSNLGIGDKEPSSDIGLAEGDVPLEVTGVAGRIERVEATVSSSPWSLPCHASGDEAIDCPPRCDHAPLEACEIMHRRLDRDWWPERRAIWRGRWDEVRASLVGDYGSCVLVYERHVNLSRWIGTDPTAEIPIGLVGKPASWLSMHRSWDETREWRTAATGDYITGMDVSFTVEHGLVTEVRAIGHESPEAIEEIVDLTKGLPVTVTRETNGQLTIVARAAR